MPLGFLDHHLLEVGPGHRVGLAGGADLELAHGGATAIFLTSALGVIPTAALMGRATEELAVRSGPGIGGLLNVTFGNAPELIIALFALNAGLHEVAPPGSANFVLTFRNLHNWIERGEVEAALRAFHKALKPGGVLGVVDHRGRTDLSQEAQMKSGYVREDYAIAVIEKAGFRLAGRSEVNANPKDTKDHPVGVWALPPTYRMKDQDRAKFAAIGESDRFTLKFVKR